MKTFIPTLFFLTVLGLMGLHTGCAAHAEEGDAPVDPDTLREHIEEAADLDKKEVIVKKIDGVHYLMHGDDPTKKYSGWVKDPRGDGAVELCKAVDGIKNGPFARYYKTGAKWVACTMVDGEYHGLFREWDEDGNLTREVRYEHGKKVTG